MGNVPALRVLDGGLLEHAKLGKIDGHIWADSVGRVLADSGRTETVAGWGRMDGELRVLVDETGRDAYYIHA
jgi:hypothetical protein